MVISKEAIVDITVTRVGGVCCEGDTGFFFFLLAKFVVFSRKNTQNALSKVCLVLHEMATEGN